MKIALEYLRLASICLTIFTLGACVHLGSETPQPASSYRITGSSETGKLATAKLCESAAAGLRESDPAQALGYYLQAAKATLGGATAGETEARAIYNRSVATATELAYSIGKGGSSDKLVAPGPEGPWHIDIDVPQYDGKPLDRIDSLTVADDIKSTNKKRKLRESVTRDGIGGTLVAYQKAPPEHAAKRPYRLPIGMSLPVTAVADFSGTNRARIRIYDTMLSNDVSLSGRKLSLAANYSASLHKLMSYAPKKNIGFEAMKHPDEYLKDAGIFMVEPYRPGQIPVLFVHGLKDEPATWRNTYNELIADPEIRKNFQFWFFRYPTGFPITYTSNLLRQHLDGIQQWASENGGGVELKEMVLIGHSMGSVISSYQIRESGSILRERFLARDIEDLDLDEKAKDGLRKLTMIESPKFVSRAIFVAGPHRGAKAATGVVGALGYMLIDLSKKVTTLNFFDFDDSPADEYFTELGSTVLLSPADGIRSLKPYNPALMEVVKLPVGNHITYHSIIGTQGREIAPEDSSDSVVDYWSSHLDGVASEKLIPSDHSAHDHPEGIAEIRRILHEHRKKLGR